MPFRSSNSATSSSTTSLACSNPAGLADGDLLVAGVTYNNTATITPPSGWTLVETVSTFNGRRLLVYAKIAASEGGSWSWGFSVATSALIVVGAWSGMVQTTAPNIDGSQANSSSVNITAPSVTTTVPQCELIGIFSIDSPATGITPASGMTEREDVGVSNKRIQLATETLSVSGATGTRVAVATNGGSNAGWLGAFQILADSYGLLLSFP